MPYFARPRLVLAAAMLALPVGVAHADDIPTSMYSLLPTNVTGSSRTLPGESRENRLSSERALVLSPRLQWMTTTDLSRTRLDQPYPVRAQSLSLSTGPRIRLSNTELALPFNAGRDDSSLGSESTWTSSAPRMTVALGPKDKVKLEAKLSSRNVQLTTSRKRSASVSWLHRVDDRWTFSAGVRQEKEIDGTDSTLSSIAETYASVEARMKGGWRWSLASSLSGASYGASSMTDAAHRDRSASLSLSTRYPLYGGWWISGELKTKQTWGESETPLADQSGGLKLFRNF